jgi:hypothetical protein
LLSFGIVFDSNDFCCFVFSIIVEYLITELEKLQDISEKETISLEKLFKLFFHFETFFQLTWNDDNRGTESQIRQVRELHFYLVQNFITWCEVQKNK